MLFYQLNEDKKFTFSYIFKIKKIQGGQQNFYIDSRTIQGYFQGILEPLATLKFYVLTFIHPPPPREGSLHNYFVNPPSPPNKTKFEIFPSHQLVLGGIHTMKNYTE